MAVEVGEISIAKQSIVTVSVATDEIRALQIKFGPFVVERGQIVETTFVERPGFKGLTVPNLNDSYNPRIIRMASPRHLHD